jgi:hypothetical protein
VDRSNSVGYQSTIVPCQTNESGRQREGFPRSRNGSVVCCLVPILRGFPIQPQKRLANYSDGQLYTAKCASPFISCHGRNKRNRPHRVTRRFRFVREMKHPSRSTSSKMNRKICITIGYMGFSSSLGIRFTVERLTSIRSSLPRAIVRVLWSLCVLVDSGAPIRNGSTRCTYTVTKLLHW